ncbi:MAG: hypothetical protein JNL70_13275 [Saprospiraceae bacterium]|nr:hypothetical protein [Saprospiraceae bacterium]
MVATPALPPTMVADDKQTSLYQKAALLAEEAKSIYTVPTADIQKAAITAAIKDYLYSQLPQLLDEMTQKLQADIAENTPLDSVAYRAVRQRYDSLKPFLGSVTTIEIPSDAHGTKELPLYESIVRYLYATQSHIAYLDAQFEAMDKPRFSSPLLMHVPESQLWAIRNKNRPYLV